MTINQTGPTSPSIMLVSVSAELTKLSALLLDMSTTLSGTDQDDFDTSITVKAEERETVKSLNFAASTGVQQPPVPDGAKDADNQCTRYASHDYSTDNIESSGLLHRFDQADVCKPSVEPECLGQTQPDQAHTESLAEVKETMTSVHEPDPSELIRLHSVWRTKPPGKLNASTFDLCVEQEKRKASIKINEVQGLKSLSASEAIAVPSGTEDGSGFHPHGTLVFAWDSLGGLLIMHDMVLIPVQWLFDDQTITLVSLDLATAFFWTIDLVIRFLVGFETAVGIEVRLRHIARRYTRGWFIPDVCAALFDWIFILHGQGGGLFSRSWHMIRVSRTLRTLPRALKFLNLAQTQMDRRRSEGVLLLTKACLMLLTVVLIAHYLACAWYAVGSWGTNNKNNSWLEERNLENIDLARRYLTSLSWSLAQSGFASVDIYPTNTVEHLYSVCVTVLWLAMMPAFIAGSILLFNQLQQIEEKHATEMGAARNFLNQHAIPGKLTTAVIRSIRRFHRSQSSYVQKSEVPILGKLPATIQFELRKEIFLPILKAHPLFHKFAPICKLGTGAICYLAMDWRHYESGHEVFLEGDLASEMLFLVVGEMKYFPQGQLASVTLLSGTWVGEPSLWCSTWQHKGQLIASMNSDVAALNGSKLRSVIAHGQTMHWPIEPLRTYAAAILAHLKNFGREEEPSSFSSSNSNVGHMNATTRLGNAGVDSVPHSKALTAAKEAFEPWECESKVARHFFSKRSWTSSMTSRSS